MINININKFLIIKDDMRNIKIYINKFKTKINMRQVVLTDGIKYKNEYRLSKYENK
jgi:hypothetical protein